MRNRIEFSVCSCSGKHKSRNHRKAKIAPRVKEYNKVLSGFRKSVATTKPRQTETVKIKVSGGKTKTADVSQKVRVRQKK